MTEELSPADRSSLQAERGPVNMAGAALGGYFIGFLSAWSDQYISARWTNAIVFSLLILVLVFRPRGLLGERIPEKI